MNPIPSPSPLSFLRKQVALHFFCPLPLWVSCWKHIFIMQQVISLWNSLLQDVSLAFRVKVDCAIAWTDGAPKVMTIPAKNSLEEVLQAAFWLSGVCRGYSYRAVYQETAVLDVTFARLRMLCWTPGFLLEFAWTLLSPSLFTRCGINTVVSWHSCHGHRQGAQASFFTKHASFFTFGSILNKCIMFQTETQSKKCAVSYEYM